jgi:2-desacetyl-2-hydroxyethyl bacteriochlorophyllide A dehydrogenase
MKVIVCEEPDRLAMKETETPHAKPGEALVRIRRIGICGTDMHAFKGNQPFFTYPRILGHELAGEIVGIADDGRSGLNKGDIVTVMPYLECGHCVACRNGKTNCCTHMQVIGVHQDGGMREYVSIPATHLLPTPKLTLEQCALTEPLSIGAHAVRRSGLREGETALVIGSGPIGLGVMKFAKLTGAKIVAMDIQDERLRFCRQWAPVDHTVNALRDPLKEIEAWTGGDLPTVVFDATGNAQSMMNAFQYVSHGGTLVYVGLFKGDITFHDPDFHKKELTLLSSRNATREDFEYVIRCMEAGRIDANSYITHRASFEQFIDRLPEWMMPGTGVIKAMLEL